ncbi:MAG: carbohydrate ABC transporter permease [Candidatus Humimicrobiaceae bacterium]
MLLTSFKTNNDIFTNPYGLPTTWAFNNYSSIVSLSNYYNYFRNSLFVTITSILLILILSLLPSYIIAKYKFFGKNFIYLYFLAGIMVPIKLGTLNIVQTMNRLSLTDSLFSLILIYTAMGIPFGILILTNFIKDIPEELSNAARIDGCSEYGIFYKIIIPNIKPAIAAAAIINILPIWNDFWFPLILINSNNLKTVPLATANLFGQYQTDFGLVFAALSLASFPMIIFYLIISKQFIKGIETGALKG